MKRTCLVGRLEGHAGPANFQRRLAAGLERRGIEITYDPTDTPYDAALVIGGTRNLGALYTARRSGALIVQRLNGMNWMHRRVRTGARHFLRAEANNLLLRLIRRRIADGIVYQSQFAQEWWEKAHGRASAESAVIHNAVPLDEYSPRGDGTPSMDRTRLLMVEGNFAGGYEVGLKAADRLRRALQQTLGQEVELAVAGNVSAEVRANYPEIRWLGGLPPEQIPALNRTAHLLYSGDPNPACPNSVIEAMACGTPVVAYDTGALPELVQGEAGRLADYGADPWNLDEPDPTSLQEAALEVLGDPGRFRAGARARAEAAFDAEVMVNRYMSVLFE